MADKEETTAPKQDERTILEMKVVSPPGARVRETEIVLSNAAAKRLQIKGKGRIPPRVA